jgi:hypothetical protein
MGPPLHFFASFPVLLSHRSTRAADTGQSIATAIALLGFLLAAVTSVFGLAIVAVVGPTAAFAKRQDGIL